MGEFQNLYGIALCKEKNINWTTWTYKGTGSNIGTFFWYIGNDVWDADLQNDSYELILAKWGEVLQTKKFQEVTAVTQIIKDVTK